jgi:hypothetical protein
VGGMEKQNNLALQILIADVKIQQLMLSKDVKLLIIVSCAFRFFVAGA